VIWNAEGGCTADVPFHDLFPRLLGSLPGAGSIESTDWQPDAVVVYLGGNDWWSLHKKSDEALIEAFQAFLARVRTARPQAWICVLLPSASCVGACIGSLEEQASFAADMTRCWTAASSRLSDPLLCLELVSPQPPCSLNVAEDWGQMGHWSVQGNAKWASAVAPLLAARLGWGS